MRGAILPLFVLIPLSTAFLISLLGRRLKNFGDVAVNGSAIIVFFLSVWAARAVMIKSPLTYFMGGWPPPMGINLVLDGFSAFMIVIVNFVCLMAVMYSLHYTTRYTHQWKFYTLFLLMTAGMNGVLLSGDMFNLYIMLEMASIAGYVLVAFGTEPEDLEAAFKYTIMGAVASIMILLGVALLYSYTSTLNMADMASVLALRPKGALIGFVSVLFLAGFGLKSALVPFHAWLPDAHSSAPSPVSATLSGVFIKTLGIYAMCRVFFNVIGIAPNILFIFMVLGLVSMVVGALLAIAQDDIKRMLAYSSISQVGYIVFAIGIGTPLAVFGGLFHLFNHAVFKSLLFLNAGAVEYSACERSLKKMGGLNKRMPVTACTNLMAAMGISGVPPFGGFWSKFIIIIAAVQTGHYVFAGIAALVSIITLAYYLKLQTSTFFGKLSDTMKDVREAPFTMVFPMVILAIVCLLSGAVFFPWFKPFIKMAVDALL